MTISTKSGAITINKRTAYGKFILGYTSTSAWSGRQTLSKAWQFACDHKTPSISWQDLGVMVGNMFASNLINI